MFLRWCAASRSMEGAVSMITSLNVVLTRALRRPMTYMRFSNLKLLSCEIQSIRDDNNISLVLMNLPISCVSLSLTTPAIDYSILNGYMKVFVQRRALERSEINVTRGILREGYFSHISSHRRGPHHDRLFVILSNYMAYVGQVVLKIGSITFDRSAVLGRLQSIVDVDFILHRRRNMGEIIQGSATG